MGNHASAATAAEEDPPPPPVLAALAAWVCAEHTRAAHAYAYALKLIHGCAGSRKTACLLYQVVHFAWCAHCPSKAPALRLRPSSTANALLLTKVGSVTDELVQRLVDAAGPTVRVERHGNHTTLTIRPEGVSAAALASLFRDHRRALAGRWAGAAHCTDGLVIEVANFDAWVHHQLSVEAARAKAAADEGGDAVADGDVAVEDGDPATDEAAPPPPARLRDLLRDEGDQFQRKLQTLDDHVRASAGCDAFWMRAPDVDGQPRAAHYVAVDECQDIPAAYIELLCALQGRSERTPHPTRLLLVGDRLQTVVSTFVDATHPMDCVLRDPRAGVHHLYTNYRCPLAHVELVNAVTKPFQEACGLDPMVAANTNRRDKPLLFPHYTTSSHTRTLDIAQQVKAMLQALFEHDPTLRPGDVGIVMRKTNDNAIMDQLVPLLQAWFAARDPTPPGTPAAHYVKHLKTKYDTGRVALSWADAAGQCVLVSICGDKGRHHRAVVVLGVTDGCIPLQVTRGKPAELCDWSSLNVALTRSTQYLMVGFAASYPSRYLDDCQRYHETKLETLCHCAWQYDRIEDPLYRAVAEAAHDGCEIPLHSFPRPHYKRLTTRMVATQPFAIKDDVAQHADFEHVHTLLPSLALTPTVHTFGARVSFADVWAEMVGHAGEAPHEDWWVLLGEIAELVLLRLHRFPTFEAALAPFVACHAAGKLTFTARERALCRQLDARPPWRLYGQQVREHGADAASVPPRLVHATFEGMAARLPRLLDAAVPNADVSPADWWDLGLLWRELHQPRRTPGMYAHYGRMADASSSAPAAFAGLHANVAAFARSVDLDAASTHRLQTPHALVTTITDKPTLRDLGFGPNDAEWDDGLHYGLVGQSDLLDTEHARLIELKASHVTTSVPSAWLVQALLYTALVNGSAPRHPGLVSRVCVTNVLEGQTYEYTLTPDEARPSSASAVVRRVLRTRGYPEACVGRLLRGGGWVVG